MPPFSNGPEQDDYGMRACCIMDCDRLQRSVCQVAERGPAADMVVEVCLPAGGRQGYRSLVLFMKKAPPGKVVAPTIDVQ